MTYTKKEREYYNIHRNAVCKTLGITVNQYNYLRRLGELCRKVYENDCNGLYADEFASNDARVKAEVQIVSYFAKQKLYHLNYYLQTDPRGATLYMDTKDIPENNYTSAYCIY